MVITKTPFRVSLVGGGTDLPFFYRREEGHVVSMTINKSMYVTVNRSFDEHIRVSYSKTEIVSCVDEIRHPIVRAALTRLGITQGLEIVSVSDIPARAGLGSSSTFTVGLLNALYAYQGKTATPERLAREACEIEIGMLGEPIGKQDQTIVAHGGLRHITFQPDEEVFVEHIRCPRERRAAFLSHLMLFWTGNCRDAREVLTQVQDNGEAALAKLRALKALTQRFRETIESDGHMAELGEILHESWLLKRSTAKNVSTAFIEDLYDRARRAGAIGGKILGAGGGGFLLLVVRPQDQANVANALQNVRQIFFRFHPQGSRIIFHEEMDA